MSAAAPNPFAGKVGLVTGGGTGIGRATALALARAGADAVAVNYSSSDTAAEAAAAEIRALGCAASALRADVGDDAAARRLVTETIVAHGRLDFLVNSAGITRLVPYDDLAGVSDEDWAEIMRVNLFGAFHVARAAAPDLRSSGGAIVNVSSIADRRAVGSSLMYGSSKAALDSVTRALARALAPEVRVNGVAPGTVTTRWHANLAGEEAAAAHAEKESEIVPLGRVAGPDDVAQAILALLSAEFVTGETLVVDGGKHVLY